MDIVIKHLERIIKNRELVLNVAGSKLKNKKCIEMQIDLEWFKKAVSILKDENKQGTQKD